MLMDEVQLERVARAAIKVLYDGLNTEIGVQNNTWADSDAWWDDSTFWTSIGQADREITVETISNGNFYVGHNPSLIDAPIDRYPNVAAMAYQGDVIPSTDDHQDQYALNLAIEIMCKAECTAERPDQEADRIAAELVNARVHRTLAAAKKVLQADRNFKGLVPKTANTPNEIVTNVFVRHEEKGRGPRWFWQGARLDFRIQQWVTL